MSDSFQRLLRSGFLDRARDAFGIGSGSGRGLKRGENNPLYVEYPTRVLRDWSSRQAMRDAPLSSPIVALLPDLPSSQWNYSRQRRLLPPYLAFVAGQYGVGKTELIHQLARKTDEQRSKQRNRSSVESSSPYILPIALADCRQQFHDWTIGGSQEASPTDVANLFFGHLSNGLSHYATAVEIAQDVVTAARAGEVVIAFDAIDELLAGGGKFRELLTAIGKLVEMAAPDGELGQFRLIVTTRLEVFESRHDTGALISELLHENVYRPHLSTHFLMFDLFGESEVTDYLACRFANHPALQNIKEAAENPEMLRLLQRPLLLRIFCDLCETPREALADLSDLLKRASEAPNPTTLIELFVELAIRDHDLQERQQEIQPVNLDKRALASCTADIYQKARSYFTIDELSMFVKPISLDSKVDQGGTLRLDDSNSETSPSTTLLLGLHKCPFFVVHHKEQTPRVEFSHRIFLEYFTALGLWQSQKEAKERFPLFDELVLNVDMRKLLKGIVIADAGTSNSDEAWYRETKNSYGLKEDELPNWVTPPFGSTLDHLDEVRKRILDIMTEPDASKRPFHTYISRYFELTGHHFHPRYALFNYEGIAIYIQQFKFHEDFPKDLNSRFSDELKSRLFEQLDALERAKEFPQRRAKELLTERILSVGLRLGYPWIKEQFETLSSDKYIHDDFIRKRIAASIKQFRA